MKIRFFGPSKVRSSPWRHRAKNKKNVVEGNGKIQFRGQGEAFYIRFESEVLLVGFLLGLVFMAKDYYVTSAQWKCRLLPVMALLSLTSDDFNIKTGLTN